MAPPSCYAFAHSEKILCPYSQPPLLHDEPPRLPQPLGIGHVLHTFPSSLPFPSLHPLQPLNVLPQLRGPQLDTALELWPHQRPAQGRKHCLVATGLGPLAHMDTPGSAVHPPGAPRPLLLGAFPHTLPQLGAAGASCGQRTAPCRHLGLCNLRPLPSAWPAWPGSSAESFHPWAPHTATPLYVLTICF